MLRRSNPWLPIWLGLSLTGFVFLHYFLGRWSGFAAGLGLPANGVLLVLGGLFLLFFLQYRLVRTDGDERLAMAFSVLARVALVFCLPNLSDDFYRFVWDGHVGGSAGLLEKLPSEWMESGKMPWAKDPDFWRAIYEKMNSRGYYTVYPPALQGVFRVAGETAGESLWGMVVVMKSFLLAAELGTLVLVQRLLARWKMPTKWVFLYGLNPLVISEMVGNLHFEAFMLFFTLLGVYLLLKFEPSRRIYLAALPFALAICSKLLPIIFFPFLIRRLGWLRAIGLGLLTGAITFGLFAAVFDLEHFPNFLTSVRLYFSSFEFNANFYYIGRWFLGEQGYWINRFLPWIPPLVILTAAYRQPDRSWKGLPLQLLLALAVYQILQPVIHPWYIAPLVGLAALTRYRFPIWWSVCIPLTYLTYFNPDFQEPIGALWLEYVVLFGVIFFEWQFRAGQKTLEDWVREKPFLKKLLQKSIPARMAIKLDRIAAHLPSGETVLDLGTGNGGLCLELRNRGYEVQPVDVKNISFFESVQPKIYDGIRLPFADGAFDTVMLITVLHHTPEPEAVFAEAVRVAGKRVIVMEDIYKNPLQKHLTFFTDSLVNLEFVGHPHTNKTDAGWQELFQEKGLKLVAKEEFRTLVFFRQVIYELEVAGK